MKRQDIEQLLGGYAAGTLTEAERTALFEAALEDQALFDALADEEALRDALADPACRARVAAALSGEARAESTSISGWFHRPRAWALAGGLAAACVACIVIVASLRAPRTELQIAKVIAPPAPAAPALNAPAPEPARGTAPARSRRDATPAAKGGGGGGGALPPPPERAIGGLPQAPVPTAAPPPLVPLQTLAEAPAAADTLAKQSAPVPAQQVTMVIRDEARELFFDRPVAMRSALMARDAERANAEVKAKSAAPAFARLEQAQERPHALGLRYSLVRRALNGTDMELPIDTRIRPDEPARLRVESNERGYLYVLGPQGALFTGPVEARRPVLVDAQPGTLWVVLSREPASETLTNLVSETQAQLSGAALHSDKPLEQRPRDPAVYVANPSSAPGARVIAEIHLNFSEPR